MDVKQILMLIIPIIIIQLGVQIWALVDLLKKKKTKNLSVLAWGLIIVFGEIIGSVLYFVVGRSEE